MAGDSRLRMTELARPNDDQEDPDTLEKYLMPPDDLPREPETADGMLVMEMSQADEEVLFKMPHLARRAPAAGGCTYAKLVIGKYKGFDMELSLRRTTEGDFVPKVTAGDEELGAGGGDVEDVGSNEEDVPNEGEVGDEDEKECEQRYQLSSVAEFWTSYEEDGKEDLDLDNKKVCEMIGLGYLEFKQLDGGDPPPMSVLKDARDEYRRFKGKAGSVEHTFKFRTWNLQMMTGKRKPPRVERLPSLYKVDEANRKKRQQKEELQRIEDGQWLRSYLLRTGAVTEENLRGVERIARRLNKLDV
ncbi:hypothetical protein KC332_g511 [Hortaea werneckii]|nr:hypothetical protein KC350_g3367 [Hortaea werneckii]KAI6849928.1 hypothetical protein KC358_g956 [Hortaea werneckii]KAI6943659.1 hypothetical protein KC348_g4179 [Hortaea werneckii]KAI6944383.1 hypothetical protein KC341_g858 [Hortaea werneckii]KAI6981955.1 hypothetical protein KC321_g924 [Hortaea werneckii]